jgi:hypothetical protein
MPNLRSLSRLILQLILAGALAGCAVIRGLAPLFLPSDATPVPTSTPNPAPTPQPSVKVNFQVNVPVNTPAGSAINLQIPDLLGGTANRTFILSGAGNNVWVGTVTAPVGSLLRYRYQRVTGSQTVDELRADTGPILYRTALVTGAADIQDTVASWTDTPFLGDKGRILGIVRDISSNQGLPGIIVSAGGQQAITGFDGEYVLWNLPANAPTTVTAFAPDGSFRPAMNSATPPANGTVNLDFGLSAARTVKVTFVAAVPADTPPSAGLRLVGSVLQMGDTFALGPAGSTAVAEREVVMAQLADGRWAASLLLFEGLDLSYKYTLGSASVNGEVNSDGGPALRRVVLPGQDEIILQDQVVAWKASLNAPVTFDVAVPASTPAQDKVTIQFKFGGLWRDPLSMWQVQTNQWKYALYSPLDISGDVQYRFCRNYECGSASDAAFFGANPIGYSFTPTVFPQALQNTVVAWQWWPDTPAPQLILPDVHRRPGFEAGFELTPWTTSEVPALPNTLDVIQPTSANWLRVPVVWDAPSANPPLISFDFSRSPFRPDLIAIIRAAHQRGLKVALYPQVRPAVSGPFAGDLNLYFDAGAKDPGWWDGWFREYARFVAYYADLAAFTGADAYYLGDSSLARALPGAPNTPADTETRWRNLIAALRRDHYNAPMVFGLDLSGQTAALTPAPAFLDAVDVIDVRLSAALANSPAASLEELKTNAANLIDLQLIPLRDRFNKKIVLTAAYVSTDGGAAVCIGLAAGGCQPAAKAAPDQPDSNLFAPDLTEQQLAYEALLYVINDRPWLAGFYGYGYNSTVSLRDKYYSPRGKPAELLLASWFARIK